MITKPYLLPAVFGFAHLAYVLIAWLYPRRFFGEDRPNGFSVEHIVCFKNESKFIEKKLENCYAIDYPAIHHTFVNDNSSDGTLALLQRFAGPNTTILSNEKNLGKNQSQIRAVDHSRSDILLFSDANVFLDPAGLGRMIRRFNDKVVGLCGNVRITTDLEHQDLSGKYWQIEKRIKGFQSLTGTIIGFDGGFYCLKRENYNLKRENELSDFETAFLIFQQKKEAVFIEEAEAVELERRRIRDSFLVRIRASNRAFWSYYRIFKYFGQLSKAVKAHFILHKLCRYAAAITYVLALPFLLADLSRHAPLLLALFCIPAIFRLTVECIALAVGGMIALGGKEYTAWSHKKK